MNPFAELVLRVKNADNGTLFQQIFAMFAKISTMTEQEVIVAWQALDMVRSFAQDDGSRIAIDKLRLAMRGRINTICLTEENSMYLVLRNMPTARQRFVAALGIEVSR